jgi:sorbitol/mannitol transport system substrate-binding protein
VVYEAVANADITKPTKDPVPYVGIQYVAIPEFQGIGTVVGQQVAAALAGQVTVEEALATAQRSTEQTMRKAGYPK